MFRFSQFAAPAVVGAALIVGAAGCASDHPDEIPASANVISEGNKSVSATAAEDGNVYVWDKQADKMVWTGRVNRGDSVRVDAKHNKVYFNDKLAVETDLIDDHNYKVFFDRASEADLARHREGTTVIQGRDGAMIVQPRSGGATIVQPAQPAPNTTIVQPAQPAPNTTIVQPAQPQSNTTVITPAAPANNSGKTTVVRPDGTIERRD